MFRLSNISIRVKSLTVFSTIVAVILALGLFSLSRLSAVNDQAGVIRDRWLPGVGQVANVFIAFEHYRTIEGAVVMSSSVSEVAEEAEHLKTVEKDLADEIEKARAYLQSDEERALFGDFAAVQEKYRKLSQEKVIMYARMNDSAAADVFKGESREAFESARGILRRLMDGQAQGGATAANRGETIYHGAATLIYLVAALGLAIAVFGAWLIAATAIRPVRALTGLMGSLADGRLDIAITGRERADEVGDMARALHVFKEAAHEKQRLDAAERAQRAAEAERAANLNGLIRTFETVIGEVVAGVAAASGDLGRTAESMASLAEQTNHQAAASAAAAEQTAANVQTVAAASEEMGASIAEISRQVVRSNAVSAQAGSEAKSTAATVDGLVDAVGKIDEVVKLIQNIASQTNLLALNATIEAARAGEAGKGFAVVAGEVKALANQTAGATVEIAQQIAGIQASTQGTVAAIQRIVATIADLNDIAASIASAIEEQNATTGEITRNVQEAARGTQEVSANVAQVNAAATETGSAAGRVLDASGGLSKQADVLRGEVEAFLSGIRAA